MTIKQYTLSFLFLFLFGWVSAQEDSLILLNVGGDSISAAEFIRVYKKNLDLVKDESQKDIDSYLRMFTEYHLKLKEAKRLGLHEDPKYKREFDRYKKQLTKNYLADNEVTEALVKEAYERSKYDINASHVLVRLEESAKDTLKAYNEIQSLRKRLINEGFETLKEEVHNGSTVFVEDLGYFSVFKMVYDFETAAYNTAVGDVSSPFRTPFGYHVVKVHNKRPSRGTITAAHIMVANSKTDSIQKAEQRIHEIYKKLEQGENFESLAKQFSDDKSTARNGGKLSAFKSGQLSSVKFEDEAFALRSDGAYSKPFRTEYGWHIVKRLDLKPIESYEAVKSALETKVKRDNRSKLIDKAMVAKLNKQYDIQHIENGIDYFTSLLTDEFFNRGWKYPETAKTTEVLYTINDKPITFEEFGNYLVRAQRAYVNKKLNSERVIEQEFEKFYNSTILSYREENLENENEEFAHILKEYRDGLLLFDLMEKEIWNKAATDSIGLRNYFNAHKEDYSWEPRVDIVMATTTDKKSLKPVKKFLRKDMAISEISKRINTDNEQKVIFTKGIFSVDDERLPENFLAEVGLSDVYNQNEAFHIIDVKKVLPAGPKTFDEAKGMVINDYQQAIEKEWVNNLYKRFEVSVNSNVLEKVKSKLKTDTSN